MENLYILKVVNKESNSAMKTFRILLIFCILPVFTVCRVNAQSAKEGSSVTASQIKNSLIDSLIPAQAWAVNHQLSRPYDLEHILSGKLNNPGSDFYSTNRHFYNLINMQVLSIDAIAGSPSGPGPMPEIGIYGVSNIKWESWNGIPFIDPAIPYYCPYKKTEKPTLCGCCLYRVAAFVIPRMAAFSYPGGNNTRIYPPAYMQPRFLTTDLRVTLH